MHAQGKKDPEAKRKTIGSGFIDVFRDFAKTLQEKHGIKPKYLVQVWQTLVSMSPRYVLLMARLEAHYLDFSW